MKLSETINIEILEVVACSAYWLSVLETTLRSRGRKTSAFGGLKATYNLAIEIADAFLEKFPLNFDWEAHYEAGGLDWDLELMSFQKEFVKNRFGYELIEE